MKPPANKNIARFDGFAKHLTARIRVVDLGEIGRIPQAGQRWASAAQGNRGVGRELETGWVFLTNVTAVSEARLAVVSLDPGPVALHRQ